MPTYRLPRCFDSEWVFLGAGGWEILPDAPEGVKREFDQFMKRFARDQVLLGYEADNSAPLLMDPIVMTAMAEYKARFKRSFPLHILPQENAADNARAIRGYIERGTPAKDSDAGKKNIDL